MKCSSDPIDSTRRGTPRRRLLGFLALLLAALAPGCTTRRAGVDIVIYGGTSAGVAAAIQVSRMGRSVVLVEPSDHIGGLTTSGLGFTDSGDKSVIGGIAREFYQRVKAHYDRPEAWQHGAPRDYPQYRPDDDAMWTFEPRIAEAILENMLGEAEVTVVRGERLDREKGVELDGRTIVAITMESGRTYRARVFMDATYEGDLLAASGVPYTVGREANGSYGETLDGVQKANNIDGHRFLKPVSPYVVPGDPTSGLVPGVQGGDPGRDGAADHRLQAYCFRMCMTDIPENRIPFPKPDGYDPSRYELLFRNFEAGDLRIPLKIDLMPNRKTDTNNFGAFSTDDIGMNYAYPEATYAERDEIVAEHAHYQEGLMWTLANHPRVPESVREEVSRWGLAKDEFTDNGNWPRQIYVREARRMVSDYVMTEADCRRVRVADDPVGMGSYNMDSHNVQRYVTAEGTVQNEGDIQVSPGGPYLISYRSIVPGRDSISNLLVPVCLSSSHIAYGSIRMEPVFMILGQSAATAAALAAEGGLDVQDVPYQGLRERLLSAGQVLDLPGGWQPLPAAIPE